MTDSSALEGPIVRDIVERHASEAAFLASLRDRLVRAPHVDLRALAAHDERLEAHVDGLRIAGREGVALAAALLEADEPGGAFAAGVLAFESGEAGLVEALLAKAADSLEAGRGAVAALGWIAEAPARKAVEALLSSADPRRRRLGIAGAAVRRANPGPALQGAAADPDPALRARALRALAELGSAAHAPLVLRSLGAEDPRVRFAAAWGAALLARDAAAVLELKAIAGAPGPRQAEAAELAARVMSPEAAAAWRATLPPRTAVVVAGAAGDPAAVPWLLEQMAVPALARAAGEAFEMITGLEIDRDKLAGEPAPGGASGPTDDPGDADVAPDPDGDLPWPAAARAAAAWRSREAGLKAGRRHLLGREVSPARAREVLRSGRQRQRAAAALELALLEPGTPLVEVRARTPRAPAAGG